MARLSIDVLNVSNSVKLELEHIEKQINGIHGRKDKIDFIESYVRDKEHIHQIRATLINDNYLNFISSQDIVDNDNTGKAKAACSNAIDEAGGIIQFFKSRYKTPAEYPKDNPHKIHLTALPSLEILRFLIDLMDDKHIPGDNRCDDKTQGNHLSKRSTKWELKNTTLESLSTYFRLLRDHEYITYQDDQLNDVFNGDKRITVIAKNPYVFVFNFFKYLELENAIHKIKDWAERAIDCFEYKDKNDTPKPLTNRQLNKTGSNTKNINGQYKILFDGIFKKK